MCTTDAAVLHILAGLRAQRMRSACSAADGVFIIPLTVRKSVSFAVLITTPTVGNVRGPMTTGTVWSVVVVKKRKLPPIVMTAQESVQSADIHPMNTFGSIRKGKTPPTATVCTVHNVRQPLAKITFSDMTENVRFVAILVRMSASGNGTETNRTMLASILWSVPAVQAHRNLINFLRGTDK